MAEIPLDLLQTLIAFQKTGTVQKAAEALHLSQPAISKQLRRLEDLSTLPIFMKVGRQKVLTTYGRDLTHKAQLHLQDLSIGLQSLQKTYQTGEDISLTVGGRIELMTKYLLPPDDFKGCLEYRHLSGPEVLKGLLQKSLDIAITQETHESLEYLKKRLRPHHPTLIIPKTWKVPLHPEEFLPLSSKYPTALYSREMVQDGRYKKILKLAGRFSTKMIIPDWNQIEAWVQAQKGWAIIPDVFCREKSSYHVSSLQSMTLPHDYFVYYRPEFAKLPWFKPLIEQMTKT